MAQLRKPERILVACVLACLASQSGFGQELRIYVADLAAIPPLVLNAAEQGASRLLAEAGVRSLWTVCTARSILTGGTGCGDGRHLSLSIRILPSDKARVWRVEPASCGAALHGAEGEHGFLAVIDAGCIDRMAGQKPRAREALLAHVLAHEIGHLLLGHESHSSSGLMKGGWSKAERALIAGNGLPFSPQDAARLRVGMEARVAAAHANVPETTINGSLPPASGCSPENPSPGGAGHGRPD